MGEYEYEINRNVSDLQTELKKTDAKLDGIVKEIKETLFSLNQVGSSVLHAIQQVEYRLEELNEYEKGV